MALLFTRDVKVVLGDPANTNYWEIPVLDGYSFSQAINSTEITVNEAGKFSRRARLLFNDALAPVEWSFSTYARPQTATADWNQSPPNSPPLANDLPYARAVEEALWGMFCGADTYTNGIFSNSAYASSNTINAFSDNEQIGGTSGSPVIIPATTRTNTFDFSKSNVSSFAAGWTLQFQYPGKNYQLNDVVITSVTMDFDIDGIATLQWSGFARNIEEANASAVSITEINVGDTASFIRNRISTVDLQRSDVSPVTPYTIILTGGSITLENNITYLTPEELGKVNQPIANITGSRSISGNLTCYLDTTASRSSSLFNALVADTETVRNQFDMGINVGGADNPSVVFDLPQAHLEIPVINVEDLLTLDIAFHGQTSGGDVDKTDEMTVIYNSAA